MGLMFLQKESWKVSSFFPYVGIHESLSMKQSVWRYKIYQHLDHEFLSLQTGRNRIELFKMLHIEEFVPQTEIN